MPYTEEELEKIMEKAKAELKKRREEIYKKYPWGFPVCGPSDMSSYSNATIEYWANRGDEHAISERRYRESRNDGMSCPHND